MDKILLIQHLLEAEDHIAKGRRILERQRAVIANLEAEHWDTANARDLLGQLEECQALHVADRDRLMRELRQQH